MKKGLLKKEKKEKQLNSIYHILFEKAVVSREMKKPCSIGTKIATRALMNGEIIEVDARNGIIRRER